MTDEVRHLIDKINMSSKLYAYCSHFSEHFLIVLAKDDTMPSDVREEALRELKKRFKALQTAISDIENDIPTGDEIPQFEGTKNQLDEL